MVAQPGTRQTAHTSGEVDQTILARPGLKQFYQAGTRYLGFEPVPQGGFQLMPGTRHVALLPSTNVQHVTLKVSRVESYKLVLYAGGCDVFDLALQKIATVVLPDLLESMIGEIETYGEADTVGLFHVDLPLGIRILKTGTGWVADDWPFTTLPKVDLGGAYPQTDDEWLLTLTWSGSLPSIIIQFTVEGETADTVEYDIAGAQTDASLAAAIQTSLRALAGLTPALGLTVAVTKSSSKYREIKVVFGGDLTGDEFSFSALVVNTAEAAILAAHTQVGKTDGEDLYSATRGGPAGVVFVQDRLGYFGAKAANASLALSRTGEYFDLNIEAKGDDAARLDRLRTQTSQAIHAVVFSKYLLVFTDEAEYFAPNRTISRNEPINFVNTHTTGSRPHSGVVEIGGRVFYIARDGNIVYSTAYDEVYTAFDAREESLLASHLIVDVVRSARQKPNSSNDATRHWLVRGDGRVVCGLIVDKQEISGYVEWATVGGHCKDLSVDGQDRVWTTVLRNGVAHLEVMEADQLFQGAITGQTTANGVFDGLEHLDGHEVWVDNGGYIEGPYTVENNRIQLEHSNTAIDSVTVGLWQAPYYESRPHYKMLADDTIINRPGRIHTVGLDVTDTTSVAIAANGGNAEDVTLVRTSDPADQPFAGCSDLVTRQAISGRKIGPTVVITQVRPGRLKVKSITTEAKL